MQTLFLEPQDCADTLSAMQAFTAARTPGTEDQLWLVQHSPVFTLGLAGRVEHLLASGDTPVLQTDRGGQVTYHGPGQVVAYPLVDLRPLGIYVKEYVFRVEAALLDTLAHYGVTGHRVAGAPGIYVRLQDPFGHSRLAASSVGASALSTLFTGLGKVAALGIKVSRHCTYHGVALNVDMDLAPFSCINPCGYAGLQTVDLKSLGLTVGWDDAAQVLAHNLGRRLAP